MPGRPQNLRNADLADIIATIGYWKDQRYDYDAEGNLIYWAVNITHKASIHATDWYIVKFTYDGSGNRIRTEGPLRGSYTNMASLDWGD
jgi:YD repeat-containing protein